MVPTIENQCENGQQRSSFRAHGHGHPDNLRSESNGSMQSAFFCQGTIGSTTEARNRSPLTEELSAAERAGVRSLRNKGSSMHSPNKESQPAMSYRDSMGDVADMAIHSLGTDEIEALFGTSPSCPLREGRRRAHHPSNDQTLPVSNSASNCRDMGHKSGAFSRHAPLSLNTILWDTDRPSACGPDTMFGKKNEDKTSRGSVSPWHAEDSTLDSNRWGTKVLDNFRSGLSRFGERTGESLLRHLPPVDPPATAAAGATGAKSLEAMTFSDYGTNNNTSAPSSRLFPKTSGQQEECIYGEFAGTSDSLQTSSQRLTELLDPPEWLSSGALFGEDGMPCFDDGASWTLSGMVRYWIYNPLYPEFSSSQQFSWAIIIGIIMGFYTAGWKLLIERCVDLVWKDLPETLLERGVFTELEGSFPLYHYMWIVPAIFGGILSYVFAALPTPIPGQNEWIHNLHSRGVQSSETFGLLFILSTAGMTSGLALGPELPLVLTSGMIGSRLAVLCKQSMLQARVLHLTAAAAAIGGFFGFPMAGALFVLEVPHRTGLQYFEALSPATIASIVAVLANRLVTGNEVTGYFAYPFLNTSLPSQIYTSAIVYGLFGAALGIFYVRVVLLLKHFVHDLFHKNSGSHLKNAVENDKTHLDPGDSKLDETAPLVGSSHAKIDKNTTPIFVRRMKALLSCTIPHKPTRAGVVGIVVGALVGTTGIFIPHVLFWGEAQLQTLIDKGRTPLPVFGKGDDPTADLLAKAYCIGSHGQGFGLICSAAITLAKIFVTGLSLGLGIVGGHFWGPLFAGCAASHFLTGIAEFLSNRFGVSSSLSQYPCVAILCIMGSAHVVTFRAHSAIILILTLTIDTFDPKGDVGGDAKVAGDYSAVFPLLTVAVFVSQQVSRDTIFYEKQRSRGDIMALPEVLCEPGKEGKPLVMDYDDHPHELDANEYDYEIELDQESSQGHRIIDDDTTERDSERMYETKSFALRDFSDSSLNRPFQQTRVALPKERRPASERWSIGEESVDWENPRSPRQRDAKFTRRPSRTSQPGDQRKSQKKQMHRRSFSAPYGNEQSGKREASTAKQANSTKQIEKRGHRRGGSGSLVRVESFGLVDQEQPSLLDQARVRAASLVSQDRGRQGQKQVILPSPNIPAGRRRRTYSDFEESEIPFFI